MADDNQERRLKRIKRHLLKFTFHSPEERKRAIENLLAMSDEEVNEKLGQIHSDYMSFGESDTIYAKVLTEEDQKDLEFILSNYETLDDACFHNPYKVYYCIPEEGRMEFDSSVTSPEVQNVINAMHIIKSRRDTAQALQQPRPKKTLEEALQDLKDFSKSPYSRLAAQERYVAQMKDKATEYFRMRNEAPVEKAEAFKLFEDFYCGSPQPVMEQQVQQPQVNYQPQQYTPVQQVQQPVLSDEECLNMVRMMTPFVTADGVVSYQMPEMKDIADMVDFNSSGCMDDYVRPEIKVDKSFFVRDESEDRVDFKNEWDPISCKLIPYVNGQRVGSDQPIPEVVLDNHPNPNYHAVTFNEPVWSVIEPSQQWYIVNGVAPNTGWIPFHQTQQTPGFSAINPNRSSRGGGLGAMMPAPPPGHRALPLKEYLSAQLSPNEIKSLFKKEADGSETIKVSDIDKLAARKAADAGLSEDDPYFAQKVGQEIASRSRQPILTGTYPDNPTTKLNLGSNRVNPSSLTFLSNTSPSNPFDIEREKRERREAWRIPDNVEDLHVGIDAVFNMDLSLFRPTQEELDEGLVPFVTLEIDGKKLDEEGWERHKRKMIKKKKGKYVRHVPDERPRIIWNPDPETVKKIEEGKLWAERVYEVDDDGNIVREITDEDENENENNVEDIEEVKLSDFKQEALKDQRKKRNELAFTLAKEIRRYNENLAENLLWAKDVKTDAEFEELKEEAIKQLIQYRNADPMAAAKSMISAGAKFIASPPITDFSLKDLKRMADKSIEYSKRETEEEVIAQYEKQANIVYDEIEKGGDDETKSDKDTAKGILKRLSYLNVRLVSDSNWMKEFEGKMIRNSNEADIRNAYLTYKRIYRRGFKGTQEEYDREFDEWWNGWRPKTLEDKLAILNKKRRQLACLQSAFISVAIMTPERQEIEFAKTMEIVNNTMHEFTQGCLRPDMTFQEFNEGLTYMYGRALEYKAKRQANQFRMLYDPAKYSALVRESAMADAAARGEPYTFVDSKEYTDKRQRYIDTVFNEMKGIKTITATRKGEV